jgi:hypothetical protein
VENVFSTKPGTEHTKQDDLLLQNPCVQMEEKSKMVSHLLADGDELISKLLHAWVSLRIIEQ